MSPNNKEALIQQIAQLISTNTNPHVESAIKSLIALAESKIVSNSELKIVDATLDEMLKSFETFYPFDGAKKACIFGSARTKPDNPNYTMTLDISKKLVERGYMVVTGAGPGIMEAGNKGAGPNNSFGLNIHLPFEQAANPYILNDEKLINFKYFFTRKLTFIRETHASIIFPGGFGTHDEAFELLTLIQTGRAAPRPVVLITHPSSSYWERWQQYVDEQLLTRKYISEEDLNIFQMSQSVDDTIDYIDHFYSNYHSIRYFNKTAVLRIQKPLSNYTLEKLNSEMADIVTEGKFKIASANEIDEEANVYPDLPRLIFNFNKVSYGRLYQAIDIINSEAHK